MFKIMLCGAHDTDDISAPFKQVATHAGGVPMWYRDGTISYFNGVNASWDENSTASVGEADLCIFVIVREYGEVTWTTELRQALNLGKTFIILCLQSTYDAYMVVRTKLSNTDSLIDARERLLFNALSDMESPARQLTIIPFQIHTFEETLRRGIAAKFHAGLRLMEERNRRQAVLGLFNDPAKMTLSDLELARQVALDELEDKQRRKLALLALAERGAASTDDALALVRSAEQGVQRLAIDNFDLLYISRPADPAVFAEVVDIANKSEAGVVRRLIPSMLRVDVHEAIRAFADLEKEEVGTRTRIVREVLCREPQLADMPADVRDIAIELVRLYVDRNQASSLMTRSKEFLARQTRC